jgi:hypothetical protein
MRAEAVAEASEDDFRRAIHSSKPGMDDFFIDFPALGAAVFGDFKKKRRHGFYV